MISWQPYQLSVWLAQYTQKYCQICHYFPSVFSDSSSSQSSPIFRQFNHQFNTGILCHRCHDSIHWLPQPLQVGLLQHVKVPNATTSESLNNSQINSSKINTSQNQLIIQPISPYQYPMKQVIQNFKFKEDIRMLSIVWFAICKLPIPKGCHANNSVILPMPTTSSRIVERGFDPLSIITPYLSKHWKIPIWKGVARVDDTVSQRGLSRTDRQRNIEGAFAVTEAIPVSNIILFDDVATTGSSLQELANTLLSVDNYLHLSAYSLAHGNTAH